LLITEANKIYADVQTILPNGMERRLKKVAELRKIADGILSVKFPEIA